MKKMLTALLFALVIVAMPLSTALAGFMQWTNGGVTISATTPDSYGSCTATSDTITIAGVPAGWYVDGWINVRFIVQGGSQLWQSIDVNEAGGGTININVSYPPASDWPPYEPGGELHELHVDLSLAVFDSNNVQQMWVGNPLGVIGPGQDWDIWCHQAPPPPPPPPDEGTGTPGYWKNHPEAWPVNSITIGGISYSRDAAIAIMNAPVATDKTYTMFEQLVAAMLNVENGTDPSCISSTIALADDWMGDHPVGSGVKANSAAWQTASPWATTLDNYNNGLLCAPPRD